MRVLLTGLLLLLFGGCGSQEVQGTSDCSLAIRTHDVVYVEAGFVTGSARRDGRAQYAACDDLGDDARGAYFADDATEVQVWSFEGQDPNTVLGVRESAHRFRVFVADGNATARVVRALRQSLRDRGR